MRRAGSPVQPSSRPRIANLTPPSVRSCARARVDFWLRMPRDPAAYAQRLYAALRELDGAGCEAILIEAPPEAPEWAAVRDRLGRAAGKMA